MVSTYAGRFLRSYLLLGLIVFGLFLLSKGLWQAEAFLLTAYNGIFLYLINLLSGVAISYTLMDSHTRFMMAMAGSTLFKLLLSFAFIALLVKFNADQGFTIVLGFFVSYIMFTGFEVLQLFRNLRPHFKKNQNSENR